MFLEASSPFACYVTCKKIHKCNEAGSASRHSNNQQFLAVTRLCNNTPAEAIKKKTKIHPRNLKKKKRVITSLGHALRNTLKPNPPSSEVGGIEMLNFSVFLYPSPTNFVTAVTRAKFSDVMTLSLFSGSLATTWRSTMQVLIVCLRKCNQRYS